MWEDMIQCKTQNLTDIAQARCRQVEYVYFGSIAKVNLHQNLNQPDLRNTWTMLMTASHEGHHKIVKMLLENGAPEGIDMQDRCGWSALMFAAFTGHSTGIVELLLQYGADVNLVNKDGRTALFMASDKGHAAIVELLLKSGANPNYIDKWEKTALTLCVYGRQNCHPDVVGVFLQNLATARLADHLNPALWMAVQHCCPVIVKDILCSEVQIYDFDKIRSYADNGSTTAECGNCSCLKVKAHLLVYKTDSMNCNYQQDNDCKQKVAFNGITMCIFFPVADIVPTTNAMTPVMVVLVMATIVILVGALCLLVCMCKMPPVSPSIKKIIMARNDQISIERPQTPTSGRAAIGPPTSGQRTSQIADQ